MKGAEKVFSDIPVDAQPSSSFTKMVFGPSSTATTAVGEILLKSKVKPLKPFVNELRVMKSPSEISNMRKAGQASGRAFTDAMRQHFTTERELDTFLDYKFRMNGCEESAYVPVVAGGRNAIQIHYVRNDDQLRDGELVTVDAGGEYGGYVTDITRAWPVNGKFSPAQKDLYEMILGIQRHCVSLCREDAKMSLDNIHTVAEYKLRDGLKQLGFNVAGNAMDSLFPHHVGHYVGLAVHDAPGYPRTGLLKQGHCITIEP